MTRLILGIALLIGCCVARGQATLVKTDKGWVSGTTDSERGLRVFKGIPFAAPPVGELRWRAPQPVRAWTDTLQATEFSASPIQNEPRPFYAWSEEFIAQPEPLSEDCLYLNVWTPAESGNEKLPVFVWIYGGGLNSGSANCAIYDGAELASKGVVFVSLNYRVGVLGFLAHPELSEESGHGASDDDDRSAHSRTIRAGSEVIGRDAKKWLINIRIKIYLFVFNKKIENFQKCQKFSYSNVFAIVWQGFCNMHERQGALGTSATVAQLTERAPHMIQWFYPDAVLVRIVMLKEEVHSVRKSCIGRHPIQDREKT